MKNLIIKYKFLLIFSICIVVFITTISLLYVKILPKIINSSAFINKVETVVKEELQADLNIKNLHLTTHISPNIEFFTEKITLTKNNKQLINIENLDIEISLKEILFKNLILKKFTVENIFADVNQLLTLSTEKTEPQEPQALPINIKWFEAIMSVNNCTIIYNPLSDVNLKIVTKNLELSKEKEPKYLHFDLDLQMKHEKDLIKILVSDNKSVFVKDKKLVIKDFLLNINNSKIYVNAVLDKHNKYKINVKSKNFNAKNVIQLLNTDLVILNGKEMLSVFKDIDGSFDLKLTMTNKTMDGEIKLNKASLKLIPLADIPVYVKSGIITLNEKDIVLKNFKGWYGNSKFNSIKMDGTIKDYCKSVNMDIKVLTEVTNDFAKNYISKVANIPIEIVGHSKTFFLIKSLYNKMNLTWLYRVKKGDDILIAGSSFSPKTYDRFLKGALSLEGNIFSIDEINYYIAKEINRENRPTEAIMKFNGKFDIAQNGLIKEFGFEIPKPLPSEFLNLFVGPKFFKGGQFYGNLKYIYDTKNPKLTGNLAIEKVRIPSQRLGLAKAELKTDNKFININTKGRFKRAKFDLNGKFNNSLTLPIVVKDINLTVDNIDVDRLMTSFTTQQNSPQQVVVEELPENEEGSTNDNFMFDTNLIVVERCVFNLIKGVYKQVHFGNLLADLTLDKNGVLKINSNKFDFADGISTLKVNCDLKNKNYYIRLGAKDVNSDAIASSILNLNKEIFGKASALIELNTNESMKLNGQIRFEIKDGSITKLGYVKYLLNFVSVFRNPIAMISPSILLDLVNIPEGTFKMIKGDIFIKDNVINRMIIKSSSPQLSALIMGRMHLITGDSTIRIYTMFSNKDKGFAGFLRGFSLNNLSLTSRKSYNKESLQNFYAAELSLLPDIEAPEKDKQIFLTTIDGDIQRNNFLSSLKKIK